MQLARSLPKTQASHKIGRWKAGKMIAFFRHGRDVIWRKEVVLLLLLHTSKYCCIGVFRTCLGTCASVCTYCMYNTRPAGIAQARRKVRNATARRKLWQGEFGGGGCHKQALQVVKQNAYLTPLTPKRSLCCRQSSQTAKPKVSCGDVGSFFDFLMKYFQNSQDRRLCCLSSPCPLPCPFRRPSYACPRRRR